MVRKTIDRRIIRTKHAIACSFLHLLSEKELHTISVTELAAKANINRKTFYLHFDCTETLYAEILSKIQGQFSSCMSGIKPEDREHPFTAFFAAVEKDFARDEEFFRSLFKASTSNRVLMDLYQTILSTAYTALLPLYPEQSETLGLTITGAMGCFYAMCATWFNDASNMSLHDFMNFAQNKITGLFLAAQQN